MSTDIVKFPTRTGEQDSEKVFHPAALYLWLEVTCALTVAVLAAWGILVKLRHKEMMEVKKENEKSVV
jgi:hypothetical protein